MLKPELKHLRLREYADSEYNKTLNMVPHDKGESDYEHRMRDLFFLNMKWFMLTLLNRKDRMSMYNSLEVRVPFADYRIVEYAFNLPADYKLYNGREKGLLREALRGILPEDVISRKKSPYPKTHNPVYTREVQSMMDIILSDSTSPLLQLLDKETLIEFNRSGGTSISSPWYGQLMKGPQLIAYLVQINMWLKAYKISIKI